MSNAVKDCDAILCDHASMSECHDGCGHFSCPCGIVWDDGYEGFFGEDDAIYEGPL